MLDTTKSALRALLLHAMEHSPWHRERLSRIDLDVVSETDLEALPTMTKTDLMDNFDDIVNTLNEVVPYDWRGFLNERVNLINARAPLGGIINGGWKVVYNEKPNEEVKFNERMVTSYDWATYRTSDIDIAPDVIEVALIDRPEIAAAGAGEGTARSVAGGRPGK